MKKNLTILIILLGLFSCNVNRNKSFNEFRKKIESDKFPKYLLIINNEVCFRCIPAIYQLTQKIKKKEIVPGQKFIVFNYLRENARNNYLDKNLNISESDATIIFDDSIFNNCYRYYNLKGIVNLIIYSDKDDFQVVEFKRLFSKDFISNL